MTLEEAIAILRSPEGRDETKRVHRLARAVDMAIQVICAGHISREDAEKLVDQLAKLAEDMFPGSHDTFAIIYGRRMQRVISEVFGSGN